jgi:iron(III) transport system substrate-binding protein
MVDCKFFSFPCFAWERLCGRCVLVHICGALLCLVGGCWSASGPEVIVYTALDSEFSRPIFADFTAETGIAVRAKFDTESTKTVGLANAILAESNCPRCDVFWNNEILNTLRLQKAGLLEVYRSPLGEQYPAAFRSPKGTWHGFAARARVLIVNTDLVAQADWPRSIRDLADTKWRGRCAIAKPLFGTTATHAACLFAYWHDEPTGDQKAKEFFRSLKNNEVKILSGNKQVALSVAGGRISFGLPAPDEGRAESPARPAAGRLSAFAEGRGPLGRRPQRPDPAESQRRRQGPRGDPQNHQADASRFQRCRQQVGHCRGLLERRVHRRMN